MSAQPLAPPEGARVLRDPTALPDLRLHLIDGWARNRAWQITARASVEHAERVDARDRAIPVAARVANYVAWEAAQLVDASLWWVSPDMCDLLYATMPKVPGSVMPDHLPSMPSSGLVVLGSPWHGTGSSETDHGVIVDAVVWGYTRLIGEDCLSLSCYRLLDFGAGLAGGEMQLAAAMGALDEVPRTARHLTAGPDGTLSYTRNDTVWCPLGRSDWGLGERLDTPPRADWASETVRGAFGESITEDRRLLAALWALLASRSIASTTDHHPERQTRRRSERARVTAPSTVKVVTLRRPDHPDRPSGDGESRPVAWSHRWVVSAHPVNQPCGPGGADRKLIMRGPFLKGPDDKPLIVKPTVNAWVR